MCVSVHAHSHARITTALACCAEAAKSGQPEPKRPRTEASSAENGQSHHDAGSRAQPGQIICLKATVSKFLNTSLCLLELCELILHCC